jgi:hypothetical protein
MDHDAVYDRGYEARDIFFNQVLVLGGNGFVGGAVCEAVLARGLRAASLSRSGRPAWFRNTLHKERHWVPKVEWHHGSVFEPADLAAAIGEGVDRVAAVVSCIGAFGGHDFMVKMNGGATIAAAEAAAKAGVPRFVFVSAHDYGSPVTSLVRGYYGGKYAAEEAIEAAFGAQVHRACCVARALLPRAAVCRPLRSDTYAHAPPCRQAVCLRAPAVYGARKLASGREVPVHWIGAPQRAIMGLLPRTPLWDIPLLNVVRACPSPATPRKQGCPRRLPAEPRPTWCVVLQGLVPWVSVAEVGTVSAMVAAPGCQLSGKLDVQDIIKLAKE